MTEDREQGIKRIRLVASVAAAALFAMTAITQFQGQPVVGIIAGVLISTILGFAFVWITVTIVKYILRLFRKS